MSLFYIWELLSFYLIHLCLYIYNGSLSEDGNNLGPCWEASWLPSCYKEHVLFWREIFAWTPRENVQQISPKVWCVSFPLQQLPLKIPGVGDPNLIDFGWLLASFVLKKSFTKCQVRSCHIWEYDLKSIRFMIKPWQNLRWSHIFFWIYVWYVDIYWPTCTMKIKQM